MQYKFVVFLLLLNVLSTKAQDLNSQKVDQTLIAFGSCGHQDHPLPIFNLVASYDPDVFIFLGDNIYGDTYDMKELRSKYNQLAEKESYQRLKSQCPIWATWDDHDYGWNDSGKEYPFNEESKEIFLDFFEVPFESARRKHPGIYDVNYIQAGDKIVQVILLDNRSFRDTLKPYDGYREDQRRYSFYGQDYSPHENSDVSLLGDAQWKWLSDVLSEPADLRIIATGTQFGIEWNGFEAWANFPHEQQRMIDLIKKTKASGVVFISGDVHYSELSRIDTEYYPLYDFTASGLSSTWDYATPNGNRIEGPIMDNHFGLIRIDWGSDPKITFETIDIHNISRIEYEIPLSLLEFKSE